MATISEVRDALADLLKSSLNLDYGYGSWPSTMQPLAVAVIPATGRDYITFENGTFCRPMYSLSAIVVGPVTNREEAMAWIDDRIALAPTCTNGNPTLAGRVSNLMLEAVAQPGLVDTGSKPLLAAELRFRPFFIT